MLPLLLLNTAMAGPVCGLLGGLDIPLESYTSSSMGPGFGLYGGWDVQAGPLHLQPELVLRLSLAAPIGVALAGVALTGGDSVRPGLYAHAGMPVLGGYPFPAFDGGLVVESALGVHFSAGLRAGYQYAPTVHAKCGACPQAADHMALIQVTAGWRREEN